MFPSGADQGESLTIGISGQNTNFGQSTSTLLWFSQGSVTIIPDFTTVASSTLMTGDFTFSYAHPPGYYDVLYYDLIDGTLMLNQGFLLGPGPNQPLIVTVNPNSAQRGDVLSVAISGQNTAFDQGSSTIPLWFVQGSETILPTSMTISSSTELIADFTIPQSASLGYYNVELLDPVNGYLSKVDGFNVLEGDPCSLTVAMSVNDELDPGMNNGSVTAIVSNGVLPITYLWSTGANTSMITGVAPGVYSCWIVDADGCESAGTGVVQAFQCTVTGVESSTPESSPGAGDGTATISASGGTAPYNYFWDTFQTTSTITGLAVGFYDVTVTDVNGCTYQTSVAVSVTGCGLVASVSGSNELQDGANDGSATVAITGGTAPFTVTWDNFQTTNTISNLAPGDYTVTVTDALGCLASATYTVEAGLIIGIAQPVSAGISVNVYPNPATEVLYFDISGVDNAEIFIYTFAGKYLKTFRVEEGLSMLSTADLAGGIYFYQIIGSGSSDVRTGKFLIAE